MSEPPQETLPLEKPPQVEPLPYVVEKLSPTEPHRTHGPQRSQIRTMDLTQHHYNDPPPPSVIRSYRESKARRKAVDKGDVDLVSNELEKPSVPNPPQPSHSPSRFGPQVFATPSSSVASQRPTPSSKYSDSFLDRAFTSHPNASHSTEALSATSTSHSHQSQVHLAGTPTIYGNIVSSNMPKPVPPPSSPPFVVNRSMSAVTSLASRPDSFLARAFPSPAHSDASQSSEALSTVVTSSQSHESRVRLPGRPQIVESGEVLSRTPRFVEPQEDQTSSSGVGSFTTSRRPPFDGRNRAVQQPGPSHYGRSTKHRSFPTAPSAPSSTHPSPVSPQSPPLVKPRLRRDQIVLPAPLAPTIPTSSSPLELSSALAPESPRLLPPRGSIQHNQRRHNHNSSRDHPHSRSSRRVSFPLSHIAEDETLMLSSFQQVNLNDYHL